MSLTVNAPAPRRTRIVVVLLAALVAAAVADRARRGDDEPSAAVAAGDVATAPPASALTSSWFCPLATAVGGGQANGTVIVANPTADVVRGVLSVITTDGTLKAVPIEVRPRARIEVVERDILEAPYATALVELEGGGAVVEQYVSGPLGESATPCAAAASDRWYIADGATTKSATLLIGLFNPFPGDANVDLSFSTDQGPTQPAAYRSVIVPPKSLVVLNIGEHVRRRTNIAASIVARKGRVVAAKLQTHEGDGRKGVAVALAAPTTAETWYFPDGMVVAGITERFHVYNPTQREARVAIEFTLEEGAVEPFEQAIPPGGRVSVASTDENRVPLGMSHATAVRSLNDVMVVAERSVDAVPPAPRSGFATTMGARYASPVWMFAAGSADEGHDEWIALNNVGRRPATVAVRAVAGGQLVPIEGLQAIAVGPGRRVSVRVGDKIKRADLAVMVTSDVPIVAERSLFRVGGIGFSMVPGVAVRD